MNLESNELYDDDYYISTTDDSSHDLSKVLIGAIAGAAAGSLIGGLFTEKGVRARRRVTEGSKNMANNLKEKVTDVTEAVADKYEAAKESTAKLIKKGKQKVGLSGDKKAYKNTYKDNSYGEGNGNGTKVLLGVLAASVIGSVIWSLTAEKGIETRKRIGKSSKKMATNLKDKFSDIADTITDTYEAAKEGAADLLEKGRQQANSTTGATAYRGSEGTDAW